MNGWRFYDPSRQYLINERIKELAERDAMGYEVIYTPPAAHVHGLPNPNTVHEGVIVKCSCGTAFRLETVYDRSMSNHEWVEYELCPYTHSHTKSWCGYDECRES